MDNSYKFFKNGSCMYYPCHEGIEEINCMFCYCPLYRIESCGGDYKTIISSGKQIKDCSSCLFPHKPENYEKVIQILCKQ